MTIKRLLPLAALLACLPLTPARALEQFIKSGAAEPIPVFVTDASGNPVTGAGTALTVTVRKPGASAYVAASGSIAEDGNGVYDYTPTSAETTLTASKNILLVHAVVTATATSFGDASAQIVAFDPTDASLLGLTGVATAATQSANSGTLATVSTNAATAATQSTTAATQATSAATSSAANSTAIAALPTAAAVTSAVWTATTRNLTGLGFTLSPITVGGFSTGVTVPLPSPAPSGYGAPSINVGGH